MTKRFKIIFSILLSILFLGGAGAWYIASAVDPVKLTTLLVSSVKSYTGRDLKIAGPVSLSFFPRISVSAERLSLSNAAWADAPEMLTLNRIELNIKMLPLLKGRIESANVELSGLELYLQKNVLGNRNWDLTVASSNSTALPSIAVAETSSASDSLISVENFSVLDARVHYHAAIGSPLNYQIQSLSLIEDGDKTAISLNMKIQEQALELSGKMGSLSGLLKQWDVSSSHFPLDLNLTLNGKTMLIRGSVDKNPKVTPIINLTLSSKAFDWPSHGVSTTQSSSILKGTKPLQQSVDRVRAPQSNYLFSNETIPFDALPQAKGKIEVNIASLGLAKRKPIENLHAILLLDGSSIDIPHLTLQMGKGSADIQIKLSHLNTVSPILLAKGVTKDFTLENFLARVDPHSKVSGGNMKLAFDIKTSGVSLHQMAENSNGKIQISINQARMGSNFLNDAGDFVVTLLDSMNPLRKKSTETILECAVAYMPINNGQINIANTVGAQTDRLDVVLAGSINLKTEAVSLTINPREKSGLTTGIDLAGLVKMSGSLMDPKVGINQAGVVNSAISIGLGVLTGGATILAENARSMSNKSYPCRDALHPWSDIYPGAE
jgi:uncharacterized protein involved in outer membrane biogenesis